MSLVVKLQILKTQQARIGEPGQEIGKAVKAALQGLLASPARPRPERLPPGEPKTPVTVWLSDEEEARVRELVEATGFESPGIYLGALLHASMLDEAKPQERPIDRLTDALGLPSREAQRLFAAQISEKLFNAAPHSVLLAEAATGIGKSLGFLSVAVEALERDAQRHVIIAAPAYNVLHQSFAEWCALRQALPQLPEAVLVMGQQEYVSEYALRALLAGDRSEAERTAWVDCAVAWMGAGAPPPPDSTLTQPWTQAGLRAACPEFPHAETVRLTSDAAQSDAGRAAYLAQFGIEQKGHTLPAQVVFCTHAMLAVEVKRRRMAAQRAYRDEFGQAAGVHAWAEVEAIRAEDEPGDLPPQAYVLQNDLLKTLDEENENIGGGRLAEGALVIVDEAHLLEEAFARIFASGESVWRLVSAAKIVADSRALSDAKRKALRAALGELEQARDRLRDLGASGQGDSRILARTDDRAEQDAPVVAALQSLLKALTPFTGKLAQFKRASADTAAVQAKGRISRALEALSLGLRQDAGMLGVGMHVSWSPTLAWPSFEAGRMDVTAQLDFLWSNFAHRSVCVSATLLTQTGLDPGAAIQRILGIRANSGIVLPPVNPTWVTNPVEVRTPPAPDARPYPEWLTYPKRDGSGAQVAGELRRWLDEVSDYIAGVAIDNEAHKRGGVLVLLTSHADRAAVSAWLAGRLGAQAVVTQEPGRPLDALKADFVGRRRQGVYPVLVGVGACWTGLDLSDRSVPPDQDLLLTDVVIPRLPIGTNRTLTHLARKRRLGVHAAEMLATAVTLRQGVGRLVRRQGVTGRVLHVLDGRAHNSGFAYGRVMDRILGVYPNRTAAKPPDAG